MKINPMIASIPPITAQIKFNVGLIAYADGDRIKMNRMPMPSATHPITKNKNRVPMSLR